MKNCKPTLVAFAALALTVGILFVTSRSVSPKEATWADVLAEAQKGGYQLITTDDLWARYRRDKGRLLLVDTRQEWEYRTGHMQGAANFPMEPTWLSRWRKKADLEKLLGVDKDRPIVFY